MEVAKLAELMERLLVSGQVEVDGVMFTRPEAKPVDKNDSTKTRTATLTFTDDPIGFSAE